MANAGILPIFGEKGQETSAFADAVDVMLTGAYYTIEAALPALLEHGDGGAIVITSSIPGLTGMQRGYANALAQKNIRVNAVHPSGTATPMIANKQMGRLMVDVPEYQSVFENLLPVPIHRSHRYHRGDRVFMRSLRPLHHRYHPAGRRRVYGQVVGSLPRLVSTLSGIVT